MSSFSVDKKIKRIYMQIEIKLDAQPTEPVSLTFHSVLRKLNTEIDQSETRIACGGHVC
jgi:hypothetical protein